MSHAEENAPVTLLPVNDDELTSLLYEANGRPVNLAFGVGGAALKVPQGEPLPWYVERLGLMRGVLNENCDGAGI